MCILGFENMGEYYGSNSGNWARASRSGAYVSKIKYGNDNVSTK